MRILQKQILRCYVLAICTSFFVLATSTGFTQSGGGQKTIGDFLSYYSGASVELDQGFYTDFSPAKLELSIRQISCDNYSQAIESLDNLVSNESTGPLYAKAHYWLGIAHGLMALDYPEQGNSHGSRAIQHFEKSIAVDSTYKNAPEMWRIRGELAGLGYTHDNPSELLEKVEESANQSRNAVDFYYAGVVSRTLAKRAWAHTDTTEMDKRTLSLFSKSLARNPLRYETWAAYLPALFPVGMHDLASVEAEKMYNFFQNLETPLLSDRGPALLYINHSSKRSVESNAEMLDNLRKRFPHFPMPDFEAAMLAIETSASMAPQYFEKFLKDVDNGILKLAPYEAGLYPSAYYKLGFLYEQSSNLQKAMECYDKLAEISPNYSELNLNRGILFKKMAETEKDLERKKELYAKARESLNAQRKFNYKGKSLKRLEEIEKELKSAEKALSSSLNVSK